jgi:MFS family permease
MGFGSLFMDSSSELIHSLLPLFMSSVLGASFATIGLIEGIAESTASISKVFSGFLSDRLRKRKPLVILGYGLSALTKPMFPLANSVWWVFGARFMDRIGKGIRGAPRDALVADITPLAVRGAAYGLRQSLDSVGAFLGPLLAFAFMAWLSNDIRSVLWIGAIPALISVSVFVLAVHEPEGPHALSPLQGRVAIANAWRLGRDYWLITLLAGCFALARFSEAFLILRAQSVGLALGSIPLVMVVMNIVYALSAYPAGAAADKVPRRSMLLVGLAVLVGADGVLALARNAFDVFAGTFLWGLQMGLTQGLFSKMVSESVIPELRGTAFGMYNLIVGVALLIASMAAGVLWESIGPAATFWAGAAFAAITAAGVLLSSPRIHKV